MLLHAREAARNEKLDMFTLFMSRMFRTDSSFMSVILFVFGKEYWASHSPSPKYVISEVARIIFWIFYGFLSPS